MNNCKSEKKKGEQKRETERERVCACMNELSGDDIMVEEEEDEEECRNVHSKCG